MKNLVLFYVFLIGFIFLISCHESSEDEITQYTNHIRSIASYKPDGPDKAKLRDAIMTMNPLTGQFNPKEKQRVIKEGQLARRLSDGRDFQWEGLPTDVAGRARTMMIDPNNPNKLWAGSATGGLWYTEDFRNNTVWNQVSDYWECLSISALAFDPQNTQVLYAGTGESFTSVNIYRESTSAGVGVYKTEDGGANWFLMTSTTDFDYINDIAIKVEDDKSVIYLAVASGRYQGKVFNSTPSDGLYRSEDDGQTWTQVLPNIPNSSVPFAPSDIELASDGTLYVGTMRNLELKGGGYLLKSTDGVNWIIDTSYRDDETLVSQSTLYHGRVVVKASLSSPNVVYVLATSGEQNSGQIRDERDFNRIMRSDDGGDTWSFIEPPLDFWSNIPWHALALAVDPNDANKILIGALNVYTMQDASTGGALDWIRLSDWTSMYTFSPLLSNLYGFENADSTRNFYVHGDVHDIIFTEGSSDEVIFATDGGLQFTGEMSKSSVELVGDRLPEYPTFQHINNKLNTTQYYTVALHPDKGNDMVLGGAQDNSTHLMLPNQQISYDDLVDGGDGAYCYFDSDDLNLKITSSQVNNYSFLVGDNSYYQSYIDPRDNTAKSTGTFINPGDYDDRSNLLYANLAVDGGFELLIPGWQGYFLDQVLIIDANYLLGKDPIRESASTTIELGTNSQSAFSSMKISPHDPALNATMVLGNQFGDVYMVTGLPNNPQATKIDNNKLPLGYVSGIDIGDTNNDILVTFSNYGVNSVWHTTNRGFTWTNLERNLPDIPVRDGKFNPYDDQQIIIATEIGIWGLEHLADESEQWQHYSMGFPNVRVDMIDLRKSDSTIVAATHGRGIWKGKFTQSELREDPLSSHKELQIVVYPNPVRETLHVKGVSQSRLNLMSISGKSVRSMVGQQMDVSDLQSGIYFLKIGIKDREEVRKILIE